ncbi:MAG: hypothetical protein ACKVRN_05315 [Pyrinomonadaceae bacterium]
MIKTWPFDQDENAAAITTRQVLENGFPILHAVHYSDDHSWAFTFGTTNDVDDGVVVCMIHPVDLDPTLELIADLEPGWVAFREAVGKPWECYEDDEM